MCVRWIPPILHHHVPALHISHAAAFCAPDEDTSAHSVPAPTTAFCTAHEDTCLPDPHLHGGDLRTYASQTNAVVLPSDHPAPTLTTAHDGEDYLADAHLHGGGP